MKKSLMLFIASILVLPGFVLGGNVVVNNASNRTNQCSATESKTYWYYLTNSEPHDMYDNFINTSADSYITVQDNNFTGTSVEIWRNNGVISNCNNWNRTSTAVRKNNSAMVIKNQDGCTFNIPSYTKVNNPNGVDAQVHYTIGFVQFNYGVKTLTDKLYYTTYGNNLFTCFSNGSQVSDGSSCPSSNIMYSKEYFHKGECMDYKLYWCGDGLVNSATGTTYNNRTYTEECDPNDPTRSGWNNNGKICNASCKLEQETTCEIIINPNPISLGEIANIDYVISGQFNSPTYLEVTPNLTAGIFPHTILGGALITTGTQAVGPNIPGTGTYTFYINGTTPSGGSFSCTGVLEVADPALDIEKEIDYISGDVIHYNINLTNNGTAIYHNAYIRDRMPIAVSYMTSSIAGISNYNFGTWTSGSRFWFEYSGFDLNPGQTVTVSLTGQISGSLVNFAAVQQMQNMAPDFLATRWYITQAYAVSSYNNQITNCAYTEGDEDCVEFPVPYLQKSQSVRGQSFTTGDVTVGTGETITYRVDFANNGGAIAYNVRLLDRMPLCIIYSSSNIFGITGYTFTTGYDNDGRLNLIYSGFNLAEGQTGYLIVTGFVSNAESCQSTTRYKNDSYLYFYDPDQVLSSSVEAIRGVLDSMSGYLNKSVDKDYVNVGDVVTYTIDFQNIGDVDWTSYVFTDYRPEEVDFGGVNCTNCTVSTSGSLVIVSYNNILQPGESGRFTITGTVNSNWDSSNSVNIVYLDYTTQLGSGNLSDSAIIHRRDLDNNCGNGTLDYGEECDGGYKRADWEENNWFYIIDYLDYNHKTPAGDGIAGQGYYCTKSCKLRYDEPDIYEAPSCLNVDTTISVMDNEMIPFWRRMWQADNVKFVNGGNSTSCNPSSDEDTTKINKDTMICHFSIYNGDSNNQRDGNPVYTFTQPCFDDIDTDYDTFFSPFDNETCAFSWCVDFDKVSSRKVFNLTTLLGGNRVSNYGEYKISLDKVEYEYCSSNGTWREGNMCGGTICEVNFVLTKPYIIQTNAAGVPQDTTANFLEKFYDIAGNQISKLTDINDIIKVKANNYTYSSDVKSEIEKFKNKYESLAVSVPSSVKSKFGDASSVKKVPGQNIYFISGDGTLTLTESDLWTNPFTIVIDGMDVVIDGSVSTNGMIITNKKMSFSDPDCSWSGQLVKGIFIAEGGFEENNSTLNLNIDRPRCHRGNLRVQGVLIGKGNTINNITNSKRSNLNSWFETEVIYRNTNNSKLKAERRNEIFQGASLLIEYNPDLWSNTIPGSEIFTETLEVYRK